MVMFFGSFFQKRTMDATTSFVLKYREYALALADLDVGLVRDNMFFVETTSKHEALQKLLQTSHIKAVAASPCGDVIACTNGGSVLVQEGEGKWRVTKIKEWKDGKCELRFSGDGRHLLHITAVPGTEEWTLVIIEMASGHKHILTTPRVHFVSVVVGNGTDDIALTESVGATLLCTVAELWRWTNAELAAAWAKGIVLPLPPCGYVVGLNTPLAAFSSDNSVVWLRDEKCGFHAYDRRTARLQSSIQDDTVVEDEEEGLGCRGLVSDIVEFDGRLHVLSLGYVEEIDKSTLQPIRKLKKERSGCASRFVVLGRSLFVAHGYELILVNLDAATHTTCTLTERLYCYAPSSDGKHLYALARRVSWQNDGFLAYEYAAPFDANIAFEGIKSGAPPPNPRQADISGEVE